MPHDDAIEIKKSWKKCQRSEDYLAGIKKKKLANRTTEISIKQSAKGHFRNDQAFPVPLLLFILRS